jgi:hypothetical protein
MTVRSRELVPYGNLRSWSSRVAVIMPDGSGTSLVGIVSSPSCRL